MRTARFSWHFGGWGCLLGRDFCVVTGGVSAARRYLPRGVYLGGVYLGGFCLGGCVCPEGVSSHCMLGYTQPHREQNDTQVQKYYVAPNFV